MVSTQFVEIVGSCWIFVVAIVVVSVGEDLVRTAVQGILLRLWELFRVLVCIDSGKEVSLQIFTFSKGLAGIVVQMAPLVSVTCVR